ncbi:MAG: PAS domain-containing protein [Armatimonadetes bacterium]|nr:PAS domain-containing protein [Armatimonadota bacterium]
MSSIPMDIPPQNPQGIADAAAQSDSDAAEILGLRAILESTDDRVWIVGRDFCLVLANEAFHTHVSMTMRRRLHRGDTLVPDDMPTGIRDTWVRLFERALSGETFTHVLTTVMTPAPRVVEYRLNPVRGRDGAVTRVVVRARDITEARRAQEALQAGEQRYRAFVDANDDMVFMKDDQFRYVLVNRRNCEYFGLPEADIIGRTDEEFMTPEAAAACRAGDLAALQRGGLVRGEELAGGRTYETLKFPVPLLDGSTGVGGIVRDVTDQRQVEQAYRRSSQMFRDMAEQVTDVLYTTDTAGVITYQSPSCRALFGRSPEEMIGRPFAEYLTPGGAPAAMAAFEAMLASGQPVRAMRISIRGADGQPVHAELNGAPLQSDGRVVGAIGTIRDVTDQVQADIEARRRHKLEALGTLASGIAHDFNNILHGVQGMAEDLEEDLGHAGPGAEKVAAIRAGCGRATELIDKILAYVRTSEQVRSPQPLQQVVADTVKLVRASIPRSIKVVDRIDAGCGPALVDAGQVHQVAMNLCTNGWQAMRSANRGVLTVALEPVRNSSDDARTLRPLAVAGTEASLREGAYTRLRVSDTGVGIPDHLVERIFDPYYSTRKDQDGSGLGLATVLSVARSHDAVVLVESRPGDGSAFSVYFPVVAAPERPSEPPAEAPAALDPRGSERILFVDDEEVIIKAVRAGLGRLGYRVTAFADPVAALEALRAAPGEFDVLVSDLAMVEMSGLALAAEAREVSPDLTMLLCTGYSAPEDSRAALEAGIHAVLKKPILTKALALAIREALASRGG